MTVLRICEIGAKLRTINMYVSLRHQCVHIGSGSNEPYSLYSM
jgi:hypothetical protein